MPFAGLTRVGPRNNLFDGVHSVLSQEIGCEERLRNDRFCVEWDAKPLLNQSVDGGPDPPT